MTTPTKAELEQTLTQTGQYLADALAGRAKAEAEAHAAAEEVQFAWTRIEDLTAEVAHGEHMIAALQERMYRLEMEIVEYRADQLAAMMSPPDPSGTADDGLDMEPATEEIL